MESIDPEPEHELQVTRIALLLFDRLAPLHGLGARERELLESAAMVHDIGMCVSNRKHHKHTYDLIRTHRFGMWRPEEVDLIALVARHHRKAEPDMKSIEYAVLPENERTVVRKLVAILRLSDGLDRAHLSTLTDLEITWDCRTIEVRIHSYRDCGTEIWGAERKAAMFETVFGRRVCLQACNGFRAPHHAHGSPEAVLREGQAPSPTVIPPVLNGGNGRRGEVERDSEVD
jgi:exopolyphosphatase/guanosine-5'-triphosphate,3'-diphosphate pyrophosphatase